MSLRTKLDQLLAQTSLQASEQQRQQLIGYVELLHKWNAAYNLTSVRDPQEMISRHLLDSLVVGPHLQGQRFIDVGTGPGLPGIPLAILYPEREFTLLDSLGKRVRFLQQVKIALNLRNVTPVQSRVEAFDAKTGYDGVLSRAFASLNDMLQWCHHLPTADGRFYALKGQYPSDELQQIGAQFALQQAIELQVPGCDAARHLVIMTAQQS